MWRMISFVFKIPFVLILINVSKWIRKHLERYIRNYVLASGEESSKEYKIKQSKDLLCFLGLEFLTAL